MKWAMTFRPAGSPREPARTQIPMATERMWGICSATSTKPFGRASLSMEIPACFIALQIMAQSEGKNYCAFSPPHEDPWRNRHAEIDAGPHAMMKSPSDISMPRQIQDVTHPEKQVSHADSRSAPVERAVLEVSPYDLPVLVDPAGEPADQW